MNIFDFFLQNSAVKVKLNAPHGIHLRPCATIASIAKNHKGKILIAFDGNEVNAKEMNKILALGLKDGDEIIIRSSGKDAKIGVQKIVNFLETLIDERENIDKIETCIPFSFEGENIKGTIVSSGFGIGKPYYWQSDGNGQIVNSKTFDNAYRQTLEKLLSMGDNDIFVAQKALLESLPKTSLEEFESAINIAISSLKGSENEAKIADYKDLLNSIKTNMSSSRIIQFPQDDFILIADELLPSDVVKLSSLSIKGVVIKNIPPRSHTAMLLRSYKIPTISIDDDIKYLDEPIIIDATNGILVTKPTKNDIFRANEKVAKDQINVVNEHEKRFETAMTTNGKKIKVMANISDLESAKEALMSGCDGIGLFRSEFLFQEKKPSLDEQREAYSEIFSMFDEVTVRTLDVGGDKKLPYVDVEIENNPFLGVRGVRLFKTHIELMSEQLLAILSAKRKNELKIMFPMVATVDEFIEAKEFALAIAKENELSLKDVKFGIMIEVPSVLFLLEEFNKVVDFYSIGTNDLSQYLFAIDRTHKYLTIDPHSSVIYDAIKLIIDKSSKPVSICGELASEKEAINRLISIGIDTFSVPSQMVAAIKSRIRNV